MFSALKKLWKDEEGSVIATEYILLAGVVAFGAGAMINQAKEAQQEVVTNFSQDLKAISAANRIEKPHSKPKAEQIPASIQPEIQPQFEFMVP